ncbi:MAG: hypothetical protein ABW133_20000 [Polyangiaceae bacterium]
MSRKPWHALRALRVMLACLALWLPARAASAAFGPVDAVVMIAEIGRGESAAELRRAASTIGLSAKTRGPRDDASRQGVTFAASAVDADYVAEKACRGDRDATASLAIVERWYLQCCVFLC